MQSRSERARQLFEQGYTCSQSVCLAFSDLVPLDEETLAIVASGFGGGVGRMRGLCGCVSGMTLILNLLRSYSGPSRPDTEKAALYAEIQTLAQQFRQSAGSLLYADLLGQAGQDTSAVPSARTKDYYAQRPCAGLCALAADILSRHLQSLPQNTSGQTEAESQPV